MKKYNIKIGTAFLLVLAYFGIMLFYTFLDVTVWRKVFPDFSNIINMVTIVVCIGIFCCISGKNDRLPSAVVV